jgi:hypothetical protein
MEVKVLINYATQRVGGGIALGSSQSIRVWVTRSYAGGKIFQNVVR